MERKTLKVDEEEKECWMFYLVLSYFIITRLIWTNYNDKQIFFIINGQ